ncbi:MAG: translation initiation factor [Chitinophagales bacterium]
MSKKVKFNRINVVYSTNPDFKPQSEEEEEVETLEVNKQQLKVLRDRKKRGGKTATLVEGFVGSDEDLKELGKTLKSKCGVGGSAKDGVILVQGDVKEKVYNLLKEMGYSKTKMSGG